MVARMPFLTHLAERAQLLRDYLLPLAAFTLALTVSQGVVTILFLIVGQAHFFMAFLYQYKAGKVNRRYLLIAFVLALAAISYFVYIGAYIPVFLISGIAFGLHFAVDEFYLHKQRIGPDSYATILSFALLYGALLFQVLGPSYEFLSVGAGIFMAAHMLVRYVLRQKLSPAERYLVFVGGLLFLLAFVFHLWAQVLAVIILLHCSNWIIGYGEKVHSKPVIRAAYWRDTGITLAMSTALYGIFVLGATPLAYLFLPTYWYVWALAHFVLSSTLVVGVKRAIA
jgi:hypothetical protein